MTCRKVRKLMPLFAGDDLGPRRTRAVRSHVDACPDCRTELEAYRATLRARSGRRRRERAFRTGAEGEWQALMVRATGETAGWRRGDEAAGRPRPLAALGRRIGRGCPRRTRRPPRALQGTGPRPGGTDIAGRPPGEADAGRAQDVVSLTMVSPETGLQIVWFLDKNFDYKGEQE